MIYKQYQTNTKDTIKEFKGQAWHYYNVLNSIPRLYIFAYFLVILVILWAHLKEMDFKMIIFIYTPCYERWIENMLVLQIRRDYFRN